METNGADPLALEDEIPVLTDEDRRLIDDAGSTRDRAIASAEVQATRWFRVALVAIIGLIGSTAWHHLDKMRIVDPYVQTVRVTDNEQVVLVEPPVRMQDFIYPAEAIFAMLKEFVVNRQRLGEDSVEMDDRRMDVEASVCGPAAQQILVPPKRDAALVAVNIEGYTPTASPQTYRVSWQESWADRRGHPKGTHHMWADITVVRRELDWEKAEAIEIWRRQPMGLCISSFLMHEYSKTSETR